MRTTGKGMFPIWQMTSSVTIKIILLFCNRLKGQKICFKVCSLTKMCTAVFMTITKRMRTEKEV